MSEIWLTQNYMRIVVRHPILLESVTHNTPYPITEIDHPSGYQ